MTPNKKATIKVFRQILKAAGFGKFIVLYLLALLVGSLIIMICEPEMKNYSDSLWYCFISITTIGFGDYYAHTILGRIVTIILYFISMITLATLTAIATKFIFEMMKLRACESSALFLDDLENLPSLSSERLQEISDFVKRNTIGDDD